MNKKKFFAALMIVFVFLCAFLFSPLLYGERHLTSKERTVLFPLYTSHVNLDEIRIKSGGPLTWVYPGITLGNVISFPQGAYDENDLEDQALLVHEVCHVWQYQHFGVGYIPRSLWELVTQRDTYVIHYNAEKSFRDYDVEEQCEIIAEYFLTGNDQYQTYILQLGTLESFQLFPPRFTL